MKENTKVELFSPSADLVLYIYIYIYIYNKLSDFFCTGI